MIDDLLDGDLVPPGSACPDCGERNMDQLIWIGDDRVACQSCRTVYDPHEGRVYQHGYSIERGDRVDEA